MDISYYLFPALFISGWITFWSFCATASRLYSKSATEHSISIDTARAHYQFYAITLLATAMHFAGFWHITPLRYSDSFVPFLSQGIAFVVFVSGIVLATLAAWYIRFLSFREIIFSINPHEISTGPYRFMRHPMYLGLTVAFLGFLLAYPTIIGAAGFAGIVFIFSVRAFTEERAFRRYGSRAA